jgi:hypothetical protein
MGLGGQHHVSAALPPAQINSTYCIGGSMGPRMVLDVCRKSRPYRDRPPDRPVASRYTVYAISVSFGTSIRMSYLTSSAIGPI